MFVEMLPTLQEQGSTLVLAQLPRASRMCELPLKGKWKLYLACPSGQVRCIYFGFTFENVCTEMPILLSNNFCWILAHWVKVLFPYSYIPHGSFRTDMTGCLETEAWSPRLLRFTSLEDDASKAVAINPIDFDNWFRYILTNWDIILMAATAQKLFSTALINVESSTHHCWEIHVAFRFSFICLIATKSWPASCKWWRKLTIRQKTTPRSRSLATFHLLWLLLEPRQW